MILVSYDMPYQNKFFFENEVTATKMSVSKPEENGFGYAVRSESTVNNLGYKFTER